MSVGQLYSAVNTSSASVVRVAGGFAVEVRSALSNGTGRTGGGDTWVLRFTGLGHNNGSSWRVLADDLGDGTYLASVPFDALQAEGIVGARAFLWWSSTDRNYLEDAWDLRAVASKVGSDFFRPCQWQDGLDQTRADDMCLLAHHAGWPVCVAKEVKGASSSSQALTIALPTPSAPTPPPVAMASASRPITTAGRWVPAAACAANAEMCGAHAARAAAAEPTRFTWVPFDRRAQQPTQMCSRKGALACLRRTGVTAAGGQIVLIGESLMHHSTFFDLCKQLHDPPPKHIERLPSACVDTSGLAGRRRFNLTAPPPRNFRVLFASNYVPFSRGLANMVGDSAQMAAWEAWLTMLNATLVVLGSGAHDLAPEAVPTDVPGKAAAVTEPTEAPPKIAPLLLYRLHLRRLAWVIRRVHRRNPSIVFVWRATPFSRPIDDGFPCTPARQITQSHPSLIAQLNRDASATFAGMPGVRVWSDPATMTFSAEGQWYRDELHHDEAYAKGINMYRGPLKRGTWGPAGMSEQITNSLFRSVLHCDCLER